MNTPNGPSTCRNWLLPELFAHAGVRALGGARLPDVSVSSLTADSREVRSGMMFVAIRGADRDGHDFVGDAVSAGASVVLVEREMSEAAGAACVLVDDTRSALAKLAAARAGLRGTDETLPRVIGITGTNGKTTVAWLLRSILTTAGFPTALLGTIEYDLIDRRIPAALTTPGAVELCQHLATARDAGAVYAVLEVSSHALDQRRCDGLSMAASVFTNLSGDHLDYHKTMEAYGAAKRRLFELLADGGVAVVNVDDPEGVSLSRELGGSIVRFGIEASESAEVDVRARDVKIDRHGSALTLVGRTGTGKVRSGLIGRHNVSNVVAAAATAEALGVSVEAICEGLNRVTGIPGRLQRVEPEGCSFSVLVDYAHTDAALASMLETVRPLVDGRLICVFGCGGDRDRSKRPRMAAAAAGFADVVYVTSDNPRSEDPQAIVDEIVSGFGSKPECRVVVEVDRSEAIRAAIADARPGDAVVIAGKGHEDYQIVGDRVVAFDDAEVARSYLTAPARREVVA